MSDEWRAALAPIGTDANKPFLEHVPALIVVFRKDYDLEVDGGRSTTTTCKRASGSPPGCSSRRCTTRAWGR